MQYLNLNTKNYNLQLNNKINLLKNLFSKYYHLNDYNIFKSPYKHFRMRSEFSIIHEENKLYYAMHSNNKKIKIVKFPIASTIINKLMPKILYLCENNKILKKNFFKLIFYLL